MIIVKGWVRATPEEIERLRPAAVEMMRATKANEPGCLEYAYAVDLADPGLLRVIERWVDDAALAVHSSSPHMAAFGRAMVTAQVSAMSVKAYASTGARMLMER